MRSIQFFLHLRTSTTFSFDQDLSLIYPYSAHTRRVYAGISRLEPSAVLGASETNRFAIRVLIPASFSISCIFSVQEYFDSTFLLSWIAAPSIQLFRGISQISFKLISACLVFSIFVWSRSPNQFRFSPYAESFRGYISPGAVSSSTSFRNQ